MKYRKIYIILLIIVLLFIYYSYKNEKYANCDQNINISNEATQSLNSLFQSNNNMQIYNNINANKITVKNFNADNFKGIIVAWYGTIDNIPNGWKLCDGSTYIDSNNNVFNLPDLRSLFIVGASKPGTITNSVDGDPVGPNYQPIIQGDEWLTPRNIKEIGGEEKVQLKSDNLPYHNHDLLITFGACGGQNPFNSASLYANAGNGCTMNTYNDTIAYNGNAIQNDQPHNNIPPHHALAYIIKI